MEGRLSYKETGFDATSATSDLTTSYVNLARDLSAANRKNFEQTTRKGVPLVYHCKLTVYRDFVTDRIGIQNTAIIGTAPKNWVFRNGAVKLHAGREAMFRNAGIKKSDRGRYDKTIRYAWNAHNQTWVTPIFVDGVSTFTDFGEWDLSKVAIDQDTELVPALFGAVLDESAASSGDNFNMPNAYLNSRRKIDLDDLPAGHGAADHSILRSMFNVEDATDDELQVIADDNQDLPPYNQDSHMGSFSSMAFSEAAITGNYGAPKDAIYFDAPFGIFQIGMAKTTDTAGDLSGDISYHVEVLGISEMQG